eukprot:2435880-Rhodomonas_salina.1
MGSPVSGPQSRCHIDHWYLGNKIDQLLVLRYWLGLVAVAAAVQSHYREFVISSTSCRSTDLPYSGSRTVLADAQGLRWAALIGGSADQQRRGWRVLSRGPLAGEGREQRRGPSIYCIAAHSRLKTQTRARA